MYIRFEWTFFKEIGRDPIRNDIFTYDEKGLNNSFLLFDRKKIATNKDEMHSIVFTF